MFASVDFPLDQISILQHLQMLGNGLLGLLEWSGQIDHPLWAVGGQSLQDRPPSRARQGRKNPTNVVWQLLDCGIVNHLVDYYSQWAIVNHLVD